MPSSSLIAIVDDDESVLLAVTSLIGSLGFATEAFPSAQALLDHGVDRFGCIVTDIQMPGLSGIELKQRLDAVGVTTPVIMITSRTEAELHARALASQPFFLLSKPFDAVVLQDCLERALHG